MKKSDVKINMAVVVNSQADARVYKVKRLGNFRVGLSYIDCCGVEVWGGESDTSLLRKPTAKQLKGV